ncbi:hypothetical protein FJY69_01410 [candidate division WOR-3 bacterium]|nr:hypothetical protein [candidate division WOR-3 bacterium]
MTAVFLCLVSTVFNPVFLTGPDALPVNPALLAAPERPGFACRILDLGAGVENNCLSLGQYNRYSGAYLDSAAKADILQTVPSDGIDFTGFLQGGAAEFGYGNLAASVRTVRRVGLRLPKDLIELALEGNALGRTYVADNARASDEIYWRGGIGVGTGLGRHLLVGVAAHRLQGLYFREVADVKGTFLTMPAALVGTGRMVFREARGGAGWAADAGVACRAGDYRLGLSVLDFSTGIVWTEGVRQGVYSVDFDTCTIYDVGSSGRAWYGYDPDGVGYFTTRLPVRVNLAVGRRFTDRMNVGVVVTRRLSGTTDAGGWAVLGTYEVWPASWLPLATRLGFDSKSGTIAGLDAALLLGRLGFSFGVSDIAGLFLGARGAEWRLGLGYGTFHREPMRPPDVLRLRAS